MKRLSSSPFNVIFNVLLRLTAVLLLLVPMLASVPATPVKALSFPAEINKQFTPPAIIAGDISTLRVIVYNPNSFPLTQTAWADNFPAGITVSSPLTVTNTCGGSASAVVGGAVLSLTNGTVPAQVGATPGQCYVEVAVTSTTPGNLINTIPAGAVAAKGDDGGITVDITNTTPASATLNVVGVTAPTLSKSFAPNTIYVGGNSTLTINVTNNDHSTTLTQTILTDYLPTNLVLATPPTPTLSADCGSGTLTATAGDTFVTLNNAQIGATKTCVITVQVTSAVQGAYTNTIPAGPGGLGSIQTRQGVTNGSPATANINVQAFTLTKAFIPASIGAGNTSTLTITVRNRANFAYTGVSLFDNLYPYVGNNLEFVGGTATFAACGVMSAAVTNTGLPSTVNNLATFSGGSIAAGATCTITISVRAFQNTPAAAYPNTIAAGQITTTQGATNDQPVSANLTVTGLSVGKAFAPASIPNGTTTVMTITITNPSTLPYTITALTDNLAAPTNSHLSVAATPAASTTCAGGAVTAVAAATTVTLTGGTIPASGSCTITVTLTGTAVGGPYINTIPAGALTTTQGGTNAAAATATVTITGVVPTGAKAFSGASGANNIQAGGTATLTITLTNPVGAAALTGMNLIDNLATTVSGLQFTSLTSNSCGGAVTGTGTQVITLTGGALLGGSPAHTCTIVVVVTMPLNTNGGTVTNSIPLGNLTDDQGIGLGANVTRTLVVRAVDLASKTFTPSTFQSGGVTSLVITLQNYTPSILNVNTLTDNLPAQLSIAAYPPATAPGTTCTGGVITAVAGTQAISIAGGQIPSGTFAAPGTCTVTLPVTGTLVGSWTNTIPVGGLTTVEGPTSRTARSAISTIYATGAGVTLTKGFVPVTINAGSNAVLTLTISAPLDATLTNFSITDPFPANMVVGNPMGASVVSGCGAAAFAPAPTAGNTFITVSGGTITPGTNCVIQVNVTGNIGGVYANTIKPANITDTQNRSIPANVTTNLTANVVSTLTVTKDFQSTGVNVNGLSTLTIYLDNANLSTLINASLTDNLPGTALDGVRVASTPNASTTCGAGVITAVAGAGAISMANGTIPARVGATDGLCSIKVDVQGKRTAAVLPVTYTNTIPTANVTATNQTTLEVMNSTLPASGTLTISTLTMEVVKGFNPTLVYGGSVSQLSIILRNPNPSAALTGIAFTDTMPQDPAFPGDMTKGMIIATPAAFNTGTCGGTLTGVPGTRTFTFSGGMLPAASQCTLTLYATMTVNGNLTNTIPIGAVTTFNGVSNTTATSASLTNLAGASITKAFSPAVIAAGPGNTSTLTITIKNTTSIPLTGMGLVDNLPGTLPAGLMVAAAPAPVDNCGGTLTANAGTQLIQLIGGSLAGNASCTLVVSVTSDTPGVYTNTIPANTLTDNEGTSNHEPASDILTVTGYSLGNRIWFDTNNNGLLDGSEVGVSGVRVEIYRDNGGTPGVWDATDTFIGFATTDASGYYRFDNLPAGDYVVKLPAVNFSPGNPLNTYWSSGTSVAANGAVSDSIGPNPNNDVDSDDNGVTTFSGNTVNYVSSQAITLGPGASEPTNDNDPVTNPLTGESSNNQSNRTVDFGFYRTELSNQIFVDVNNNGIYDAGDTGLPGATVDLYASDGTTLLNTAVTNAGGTYLFSGLAGGDYIVKVTPPAEYQSTVDTANPGDTANPNNNIDNNDNGVGTAAGQVSSNTVTLIPGVHILAPNDLVDDPTGTTTNPTLDFGFRLIADLSVTKDDGVVNVNTGGSTTYTVRVTNNGPASVIGAILSDVATPGQLFKTAVACSAATPGQCGTAPSVAQLEGGAFALPALTSGQFYEITITANVTALSGSVTNTAMVTPPGDTTDPTPANNTVSDTDTVTPVADLSITKTDSVATVNEGGTTTYTVRVTNNGPSSVTGAILSDVATPGQLSKTAVACSASTPGQCVTAPSVPQLEGGSFALPALASGQFYEITITANVTATSGSVTNTATVATPAGTTDPTPANNTASDTDTVLFASIGDLVWNDLNNNGIQDGGEPGIPGVTVRLYDTATDTLQATTTTDASGIYGFTGLVPDTYYVVFTPPAGYTISPMDVGTDDTIDSDANVATGRTGNYILVANVPDLTVDAGMFQPTADLVLTKTDDVANVNTGSSTTYTLTLTNNGPSAANNATIRDATVTGLTKTAIGACTPAGLAVCPTYGLGAGEMNIANLQSGTVVVPTLPSGGSISFTVTASVTATSGTVANTFTATPPAGTTDPTPATATDTDTVLFASIGDLVWNDLNNNGIQDGGEPGIVGVTVRLYDTATNTLQGTTTTNASGIYGFTGLVPGGYYVEFVPPAGYIITLMDQGADDTLDSDANTATHLTGNYTLVAGTPNLTVDAGMVSFAPALIVTKTVTSSTPYVLNSTITYNIVVKNIGNIPLTGVTVTDPGAVLGACSPVSPASLALGAEMTCPASHVVTQPDLNAGSYSNTATGDSNETLASTATATVPLAVTPQIGVAKAAGFAATPGLPGRWDVTYQILVKNYGNVPLSAVQVTDNLLLTFPLPTTFTVQSITSATLAVNPAYNGNGAYPANLNSALLKGTDTLALGASGTITLVVRVTPVIAGPFLNTADGSGTPPSGPPAVTDISTDGVDPAKPDADPSTNSIPTPITFGAKIFDPPIGIKTFDASGLPLLRWQIVWINSANFVAVDAQVNDPIPVGTTYSPTYVPSNGIAPAGPPLVPPSTIVGVSCTTPAGSVTTTLYCYYDDTTGQVKWQGNLGPDLGATDVATAHNEIIITFNVLVPSGTSSAYNVASINADLNGDHDFADPGETNAATASSTWPLPSSSESSGGNGKKTARKLPATGFAPGIVSEIPLQPLGLAYSSYSDLKIEIPSLKVNVDIVGVPAVNDQWDITWLGANAGYLDGTAFPTWLGNSVITGHVYLSNGLPGPFVNLSKLKWGDRIVIHAFGQRYNYEVRSALTVSPDNNAVLGHKDRTWVTLLTCKEFNEATGLYKMRTAVQAVLISVEDEPTTITNR